jgi:hypothetical protein
LNKNLPYDFITKKLQRQTSADTQALWLDMKAVLDTEMPEEKGRRRRFFAWLFTANSLMIILALGITVAATTAYFLDNNKTATNPVNTGINTGTVSTSSPVETTGVVNEPARLNKETGTITTKAKTNQPVSHIEPKISTHTNSKLNSSALATTGNKLPGKKVQASVKKNATVQINTTVIDNNNTATTVATKNKSVNDLHKQSTNKVVVSNTDLLARQKETSTGKEQTVATKETVVKDRSRNAVVTTTGSSTGQDTKVSNNQVTGSTDQQNQVTANRLRVEKLKHLSISVRNNMIAPEENAINHPNLTNLNKSASVFQLIRAKGFVVGLSASLNVPISQQEMSTYSMNGKKFTLIDYMPSVYAQYHFNKKLYAETEFQFVAPQYTPQLKLAHWYSDVNMSQKIESGVSLNKLYYLNIPVSIHYNVRRNLYLGLGLQYSSLQRSVFEEDNTDWKKGVDGWKITGQSKSIKVKGNPVKEKKEHTNNGNGGCNGGGNGGGGGGGSTPSAVAMTPTDTLAQSFKSTDWRMLFNASYQWHRFNLGLRYNVGLNDYIHTKVGSSIIEVKDKNKSFQLYLHYDILDKRRKIRTIL